MPKSICNLHGIYSGGKCPQCAKQSTKRYDKEKRDKTLAKFYASAKWKKVRDLQLKQEPLCRMCGRPATLVDHIVEIRDGGAKLDFSNLQSLCHSCHNKKTALAKSRRGAIKSLQPNATRTEAALKFSQTSREGGGG